MSTSTPASAAAPTPAIQRLKQLTGTYGFRVSLQALLTIWAVTTFTFALIRLMPGNPVEVRIDQLMQTGLTYEEAHNYAAALYDFDPDQPIIAQYGEFIAGLLVGDLGNSVTSPGTSVRAVILQFLPWTLFSVGISLLTSFLIGVLIGLSMAYWRGSLFDHVMTGVASILYGIPDYVYALLLIIVGGIQLGLFDPGDLRGAHDPNIEPAFTAAFIASVIQHALLPVITYVLATVGSWILAMKSSTVSTLGEDYITVAKARGLSEGRVLTAYVGRNAMLPLVTRLAISLGFVLGGSVIVEELFQYPGLGRQLLRAIAGRDYTTMQGIFLVITIGVVFSNVLADLMFGLLDPRVRLGAKKG